MYLSVHQLQAVADERRRQANEALTIHAVRLASRSRRRAAAARRLAAQASADEERASLYGAALALSP